MEVERLEVFRPECNSSFTFVNVIAHIDGDLSYLLPYLNATQAKARYYPNNPFISFFWEGHKVVVEKSHVRINFFEDEKAAKAGVKKLIELIGETDAKRDEITPDYTPCNPPPVIELYKLLPRMSSCGRCGFSTCMSFATALATGEAELDLCPESTGDPDMRVNFEGLSELLGN